jgi:AraC-like DNA-binding protein
MIENLNESHEIVNYKNKTNLKLYDNREYENFPEHWHTPIEIIIPICNRYTALLGEERIELEEGDILFISPGVIHALEAPEYGYRIIFQAEVSMLREINEIESVLNMIFPAITITPATAPKIHKKIKQLLTQINTEYNNSDSLFSISIYSKLLSIFTLIGRNYTENVKHFSVGNQKQKEYTEKFINICSYINNHCTDNLSLDDIAKLSGFSKYHFSRQFKNFTNLTFYKYLNQKRISHAVMLLSDPSISITEVALSSGFSSLSAFIRMFKLTKQCTPTEFRNKYRLTT